MAASIETQAHAPWAVRSCCIGLLFTALQLPAQAWAWHDPPATALPEAAAEPAVSVPTPPEAAAASSASAATSSSPAKSSPADAWETPHYDKGFVLVSAPASFELPFRLMLKHVSQLKYTNTLAVESTFTDHFGNEHEVLRRHDIQLTRDVFYFSGYVFDRKLDFNILLYTSSVTLTATAAGYIGYSFDKAFALRLGFFSLPSLRAMTGTYPFIQGTDRSMATNYMRPGFTQGIWAEGEPLPGLNYIAMLGNSLEDAEELSSVLLARASAMSSCCSDAARRSKVQRAVNLPNVHEALQSFLVLLRDPHDTAQGFRLVEALDPCIHYRELARMRSEPSGQKLLAEQPALLDTLISRSTLEALPEGSLGREYLWHVVCGYQADLAGEAAILGFTLAQTRSPGLLLLFVGALLHSFMVNQNHGKTMRRLAWFGLRSGVRARPLAAVPWEEWLGKSLDEVRAALGIVEVPTYEPAV